jgi:pimeloyl-ACP methyl ester carboxylesterase
MGSVAERWDVKSGDGGSIAVWVEGEGPPLVLVHGSVSDHTMFAMDRRGFGASRDDPNYSAEREFSDVAAVVDAVA